MLWTGGAIKKDTVISNYCSQSDLAKTLLKQLGLPTAEFPLSKDILTAEMNFSFYEFNNGFGMIADSGNYVFDNDLMKVVLRQGEVSDFMLDAGKAMQQKIYDVYLNTH